MQSKLKQTAVALSIAQMMAMSGAEAAIFNATTLAEFRNHINTANSQAGADVININNDFLNINNDDPVVTGNLVPFVTSEITINGGGHTISRSATAPDNFRFTAVTGSGNLTINDLTFQRGRLQGYLGGALFVGTDAELTLNRVTLSGNRIVNGSNNIAGGALYIAGTATINESTISNNVASPFGTNIFPRGGGIAANSGANITISNSTITDNDASYGSGAGIFAYKSTVTIINSTVSGNTAQFSGGGIFAQGENTSEGRALVTLENSTLSGNVAANGGGIRSQQSMATISLSNSIVANSTGDDCSIQSNGHVTSDSASIIEGGGCFTSARAIDPQLDPLADNSGRTQSHKPKLGSPAINSGVNCKPNDQRGISRTVIDAQCDVGSVELNPNPIVVTTLGDNAGQDAIACSLREALDTMHIKGLGCEVVSDLDIPEISFAPALAAGVITLERGALELDRVSVSIDASALNEGITLDADQSSRVFDIQISELFIDNMTLTGGVVNSLNRGGGIFAETSTVGLSNSTVSGNSATFFGGGGIALRGGVLELANSTVSENSTESSGGGIFGYRSASINLSNSTISGNSAFNDGGGVYAGPNSPLAPPTVVNMINSTVSNNTAGRTGGGLFVKAATANLMNSIIGNSIGDGDCGTSGTVANPGTITSDSNSIGEDGTCGSARATNPRLLPLENNGGPTKTHALPVGSPAVNQGDNAVCNAAPINGFDQRGLARPVGSSCDVGAYEGSVEGSVDNTSLFVVPLPGGKSVIFSL